MKKLNLVNLYVFIVAAAAILAAAATSFMPSTDPGGVWEIVAFITVALVLHRTGTTLKFQGSGSTAFIINLSAGILFGAAWSALVAGTSLGLSQLLDKKPLKKVVFNSAQIVIAIVVSLFVYHSLGGQIPPAYLTHSDGVSPLAVQRDFALFFAFAALYFVVNSVLVSTAIALSSKRPFAEVWTGNTRGVLGYDLGASAIAMVMAWLFIWSRVHWHFGAIGILAVVLPIAFVRKTYGMYRNLEATSQELLEVMVKAIEARDPYTSGHSERVAHLSKAIAQEQGELSADEIQKVFKA
ncbi:MAG: hypothetical protein ABI679_11560, partial [Gemmatimonadota bacterium]